MSKKPPRPRTEGTRRVAAAVPAKPPLASHLERLVERHLETLALCRAFDEAEDPVEALHDLRVAARRLRAFGDVFRSLVAEGTHARADRLLRAVARSARRLRDLDVHVAELESQLERATVDAERAALEHLLERLARKRGGMTLRTRKKLGALDFDAARSAVHVELDEALRHLPAPGAETEALVATLLAPVLDAAAALVPPDDGVERPEALHRLRLSLKRLRYALELFEPLFEGTYGTLNEKARRLQDLLGDHHDHVVLGELLEKRRVALEKRHRRTLAGGLGTLRERLDGERRALFSRFRREGYEPEWWGERVLGTRVTS